MSTPKTPRESSRESTAVKSAERSLTILELLTGEERALTFGEIADILGYPRSSLHGLLRTLTHRGWVEFDPTTRRYALGIRTWEAGNVYLRAVDLADRARPYMQRVRDALDETVQLAVLDGRYNVYIAKVDGTQRLVLASEAGRRLQAHATGLGKALLAGLPGDELHARLDGVELEQFTPHTVTTQSVLEEELAAIRSHGYAEDREEYTIGVRCVAVPAYDHTGHTAAAMSVSVPLVRFDAERHDQTVELLRRAAHDLSIALGYNPAINEEAS